MAKSLTLVGAQIKLYINNKVYKEVQSITLNINYNESPIYGIDSPYPAEITSSRVEVSGNVSCIRQKNSGGLQAVSARPVFTEIASSPYVSIRIQDRSTGEDIFFCQQCKVTSENHSVAAKGRYKLDFSFIGITPLMAIDRS